MLIERLNPKPVLRDENLQPRRRKVTKMDEIDTDRRGYIIAALMGAIGGGLVVALATKAIPKMMSKMMRNMMLNMREGGCDPAEM
jgi:hypothetical protein